MTAPFGFEDIDGEDGNEGYIQADKHQISSYDISQGRYIFLQYTGLKDKNGKGIFEGDVVERADSSLRGEVHFWVERGAWFVGDGDIELGKLPMDKIEVIGNIYENKELLKQ